MRHRRLLLLSWLAAIAGVAVILFRVLTGAATIIDAAVFVVAYWWIPCSTIVLVYAQE